MAQKKNLVGQRFGHLTVIEKTGETQNRYCVWRCRCDCGGEICVNTKRLMRGTVTNCGCIPKTTARNGSVAEDLTGRKYGSLTVLYRGENKNGRTRWVCKCSCGNEITVNAQQLKAGKRKSCGCQTQRFAHNKRDLTNQRFGRLVALYSTENRDSKGSVFWHCRCDCGKELDVTQDGLVYGSYRSCGCLKKEIQKKISTHLHLIDHTCLEWLENRKHRRDNTSGFRGIYRLKNGHYRVGIGFKKRIFISALIEHLKMLFLPALRLKIKFMEILSKVTISGWKKQFPIQCGPKTIRICLKWKRQVRKYFIL